MSAGVVSLSWGTRDRIRRSPVGPVWNPALVPFNQDDSRERAMRQALNLKQRDEDKRMGEDAFLDVNSAAGPDELDFELKSGVAGKGFSTGRDVGLHTLERWSHMHFVFGEFKARDNEPQKLWYGSPARMRDWIEREKKYIALDLKIASRVSQLFPADLMEEVLVDVLGDADVYTREQIKSLIKDEWNKNLHRPSQYVARASNPRAKAKDQLYSRDAALDAARDRLAYLLKRGCTVNNRHVPYTYVTEKCVELDGRGLGYAYSLREQVEKALAVQE